MLLVLLSVGVMLLVVLMDACDGVALVNVKRALIQLFHVTEGKDHGCGRQGRGVQQ